MEGASPFLYSGLLKKYDDKAYYLHATKRSFTKVISHNDT
jgi:hypothetical protein